MKYMLIKILLQVAIFIELKNDKKKPRLMDFDA